MMNNVQLSEYYTVPSPRKTSSRNTAIDVAKGIGILLVVIGHLWDQLPFFNTIHSVLYAFHMPLFFIISGMLFRANAYDSFKSFLKKRIKTLICPYILFAVLSWGWFFCENIIWNKGLKIELLVKFAKSFGQVFYAQYSTKVLNTPLWFVLCLFAVEIIYFFVSKIKNRYLFWFIVLSISTLGWFCESDFCSIDTSVLPWNLTSAFFVMGFYALGNNIKPFLDKHLFYKNKKPHIALLYAVSCFCLISSSVIGIKNGYISIGSRALGNGWCLYLTGILGTTGILFLGECWRNCRFLQFCGKNSFYIMATHLLFGNMILFFYNFALEIVNHFLGGKIPSNMLSLDYTNFGKCIFMTIFIIALCCAFTVFYNKLKISIIKKNSKNKN